MKVQQKKRLKWLIGILIGLAIAVMAGDIFINKVLPNKLREKLNLSAPGMTVDFESAHVHLFAGSLSLTGVNFSLMPDSTQPQSKHLVHIDELKLTGIHFFPLIFRNKLIAHALYFQQGDVKLNESLLEKSDSAALFPKLNFPFAEIRIDGISLEDMRFWVDNKKGSRQLCAGSIHLHDISLDQQSLKDSSWLPFKDFDARLSDLRYPIPHAHHTFEAKTLQLDSRKKTIKLDSIHIIPDYGKLEFSRTLGYQTDRFDARIASVECKDIDLMKFQKKIIHATSVSIHSARVLVFRDRRVPMKQKEKPLPMDDLKKIPWGIDLDKLILSQANIDYEEFPKDGNESGTLKIENLKLSISPFCNQHRPGLDHLNLVVDGSLMGAGLVHSSMELPLVTGKDYLVKGTFTELDLVSLNASAENLGGFHIESGILNHLLFEFAMSEEKASGQIIGEYHNLVIDKLKNDKDQGKKKDKFKSFMLQHLIIPKNKDHTMAVAKRTGKVDYRRDPNRYFSNYLLHSLLSGIKASFNLGFLLPG